MDMALGTSEPARLGEIRSELEKLDFYDKDRRISKFDGNTDLPLFGVPITDACKKYLTSLKQINQPFPCPLEGCTLLEVDLPSSKKALAAGKKPYSLLVTSILKFLGVSMEDDDSEEWLKDIPKSWEQHGDLIELPSSSFSGKCWTKYFQTLSRDKLSEFWTMVAESLKCERLAICNKISSDHFRSPGSKLVLGSDSWVKHIDNGILYIFDVTKCMFSSGNITEKLRVAKMDCRGEVVVDLYAGIGYFVLPYLVHGGAGHVHACDWNPHAVEALKRGLKANAVEEKCTIHFGDSRKFVLHGVADRVNLGLLPSSEECWSVACGALKTASGGWLHIHGNVSTSTTQDPSLPMLDFELDKYKDIITSSVLRCSNVVQWIEYVSSKILVLLNEQNPLVSAEYTWEVKVRHVEHVKQYAPHVSHIVLDVHCKPVKINNQQCN